MSIANLRQKTIEGLTWSGIAQVGKQLSNFLIVAILARLLGPEDFGLIGMATVFTGLAMIFCQMGVSSALIQKQNPTDDQLSSVLWLNVMVGAFLTVLFILISPWIANFYHQPYLKPVLSVLSFNFFIGSFSIVQQSLLTKELEFKVLTKRDILAVVISGFFGILMALNGFGVWSLVVQSLSLSLLNTCLIWGLSPWRPRWYFSLHEIKEISSFSANLTGFNMINYFARNIDYLLIGKFLGSESLGFYTLAYKLMLVPIANISWVIVRVMFPAFSKIQNNLEKLRRNYLNMVYLISLVTFPVLLGLFALAPECVTTFLGEKWSPSIPLIQVLCFCGMIQSLTTVGGSIYLSLGRADLQFKVGLISSTLVSLAVFLGVHFGAMGVAIAETIFYVLWGQISLLIICRLLQLNPRDLYSKLGSSLQLSLFMLLAVLLVKQVSNLTSLWVLVLATVLGIVVYCRLLMLTERNLLNQLKLEITKLRII